MTVETDISVTVVTMVLVVGMAAVGRMDDRGVVDTPGQLIASMISQQHTFSANTETTLKKTKMLRYGMSKNFIDNAFTWPEERVPLNTPFSLPLKLLVQFREEFSEFNFQKFHP